MSKLVKTAAVLLLCTILCVTLCGCHKTGRKQVFEIPEDLDTSRQIEITFWAKNDTNKAQTNVYQMAIDNFQSMYPNITVNMRLYTDYGRIYNDVITNIKTNTTPNVCITYPDHISTYLTGDNIVVPLDSLFSDESFGFGGSQLPESFNGPTYDEVIPEFLNECAINGIHYGVPYMRSTEACYINKTFVERLGFKLPETLTWDFIWEVCEAAMAQDSEGNYLINGQKVLIPFIYKSTDNMMIQMLKQKGAGYSTSEGEILIFNDTTAELLKSLAEHVKKGEFSTFKISGYPANFLDAGQCIFAVDSTAGATWMGANAPLSDISEDKFVDFETVVMTVPQFDIENPQMISQGPSVCLFNKDDPQEVLASWLFMQYLLSNDIQIAYSETEGYVPVTTKARNDPEYRDYLSRSGEDNTIHYDVKIAAAQLLNNNTQNTFVTPVFNGSTSLRDAAGQMIEDVTKSIRRKKTVDDAFIADLYDSVTALFKLDQIKSTSKDLGPLPTPSIALLSALAFAWIVIIIITIRSKMRHRCKK